MLLNLHVKNFAIIDEVDVTFHDNLNILTGETGAGKSIIIGSINVALGGKISKDIIRKGADYALVELIFHIDDIEIKDKLAGMDIPVEDDQIIISRKIMNGKSISKINGETVTTSALKEIGGLLLDIHGQHEHQSLLYKDKHLDILDRFGKEQLQDNKAKLEIVFKEYVHIKHELNSMKMDEDKRLREISFLEYEINEIKEANLKKGEDEVLSAEYKRLKNAKILSEGLNHIHDLMGYDDASSGDSIGRAVKQLYRLEDYDKSLDNLTKQLSEIENLVNDFNRELSQYMVELNSEEEDLYEIEKRLDLLNLLKSKYGSTIEDILVYYQESEIKLEQYYNYEETIKKLTDRLQKLEKEVEDISYDISNIRKEMGKELSLKIKEALIDLNFLDVKFEMNFHKLSNYTSNGYDEAEFLISTNPGEDLKPLAKVASGGELSRIMLAIKSVLADKDEIHTLIFDEIDVGVSGRTAQKVSEKLSAIAKNHQILCITHLPQIASMADSHYIIEKTTDGKTTTTLIRYLKEEESIAEIARILGGAVITDTVINSAKEMKDLAARTKKF